MHKTSLLTALAAATAFTFAVAAAPVEAKGKKKAAPHKVVKEKLPKAPIKPKT